MTSPRRNWLIRTGIVSSLFAGCGGNPEVVQDDLPPGAGGSSVSGSSGTAGTAAESAGGSAGSGSGGSNAGTGGTATIIIDGGTGCEPTTCAELGWACGYVVNACNTVYDCADEGLSCGSQEICVGGIDGPTECVSGGVPCDVCEGIPDCASEPEPTRLTGRVVSPGRDDANVENQIGVPNAIVYILRDANVAALPPISAGIPAGGTSCDRCEEQELGPVLIGTVTDATGSFVLEGNIPVGVEFVLVVKAGRFRRAIQYTLPDSAACTMTTLDTALPENPTRLPRSMSDGLAVNIPRIAVTTGELDAMECVLEKMGISRDEFANPGAAGDATERVHLYRGGPNEGTPPGSGARIDDETPHDSVLYGELARIQSYDIVVADCEGGSWDDGFDEREMFGENVLEYVNRGGRMFASHLGFSWLHENGDAPYAEADPIATGLGPAATWDTSPDSQSTTGTGIISLGRPSASPRIESFAAWMVNEGVTTEPLYDFTIREPRSQNEALGTWTEEFVYREDGNNRVQQFSFNTPYGAPEDAACGRVAYSGFHVSIGNTAQAIFPEHCEGNLTDQEKVLLYMLFDLGACVGDEPPPPMCTPTTCEEVGALCGFVGDGCGDVLDCGSCEEPPK